MMMTEQAWVVIPAAGVGKRMQADRPKQYLQLLDKTVIEHTLDCFLQNPIITGIVVVISQGDEYWQAIDLPNTDKPIHVVDGGAERMHSVLNGLNLLETLDVKPDSWVMVHDAARPCLTQQEMAMLFDQLKTDSVGGILALPVRDTMKRQSDSAGVISHTENREGLWHALTPQMFRLQMLSQALSSGIQQALPITDESSAIEAAGFSPKLVEGLASNLKITRPSDLPLAEFFLQKTKRHNNCDKISDL